MKTRSFVSVARAAALVPVAFLVSLPGVSRVVVAHEHVAESRSPARPGQLSVRDAWARATPAGVGVGGAYFTVVNGGKEADTLLSLASPAAATVEMHRTTIENGLSRMRPAGQIVIAPGQRLHVAPGGLHVMLTGLKQPLVPGSNVPLVLTFRHAGEITVQVRVQAATAPHTSAAHPVGAPVPMEHQKP